MYTILYIQRIRKIQIFCKIQKIRTYNVHNFLLNLCNSGYSNFLQIQTIRTFNVHKPFNLHNFVHSTYSQNSNFLQIQIIRKFNAHNFPLNLYNFGCSNFLQIQNVRTSNIHNFPLNLRNSMYSIYPQNSNWYI